MTNFLKINMCLYTDKVTVFFHTHKQYSDSYMHTLANSENDDEMPHNMTFNCLLIQNQSDLWRRKYNNLEIITCDP